MAHKLEARNVFKVFGPAHDEAVELARQGVSKDEIFSRCQSVVAVNDVTMSVAEREIFVVMGLSGSGKSTLVRCLNRLIEPTAGVIEIDGEDIVQVDAESLRKTRLSKISMVFQHFALFPHMTVVENAAYGLRVRGMQLEERREKALEALKAVGLGAWADELPSSLSGGMQQRVGLARGLAVDPQVLLMDEPFSALDPLIRREMQDELVELQERYGSTIVFITHDLSEALKIGDHIAIMKDGRFVQVGDPETIVTKPADDYVEAFTQEVDRSRVLVARSVMGAAVEGAPSETVSSALERVKERSAEGIFIIDDARRPVGYASREMLERASPGEHVASAMQERFPSTRGRTQVYDLFPLCDDGEPIAVIDRKEQLIGAIRPLDLFGRLYKDAGNGSDAGVKGAAAKEGSSSAGHGAGNGHAQPTPASTAA